MDSERTAVFPGGLAVSPESAIDQSGLFGTRRGLKNIRWYEYTFFILGILAVFITDGLTIVRLVKLGDFREPKFAYGILIIIHSFFLLLFLITGLLYQRITDIVAFFLSSVLLSIYVIAHYIASKNVPDIGSNSQPEIRLARLIFAIAFNVCFIPFAFKVINDYKRDEFSKRLFGTFPAARRPLKIYSIFDCVVRINTMLSISSLVLNLYNTTNTDITDKVLLGVGVPITLLWLLTGIGMARLENYVLFFIFYFLSVFQFGALIFILYIGIKHEKDISQSTSTTTTTTTTTTTATATITTQSTTTLAPIPNISSVLIVLFVCAGANLIFHLLSLIMGFLCTRNFKQGLKEKVFNNKIDKWFQERWSST